MPEVSSYLVGGDKVFFRENLIQALESLRSNKMRSFLTMLGIIIGIASVIAIITVGNSLSSSITTEMQRLVNNFMVIVRRKTIVFQCQVLVLWLKMKTL